MKTYRAIAALVAWLGLALQYYVMATSSGPGGEVGTLAHRSANFFSYFTVLANLLTAVMFTATSVAPASKLGLFFARPTVRTGVALYMAVTAATYILILQGLWKPQGLHWVADTTLHYVTPALVLLDWALFSPKGSLRWAAVWPWLIFPLVYGIYSIVRGPHAAFYPYPFMDVSKLGLEKAVVNMVAMSALFLVAGLAFVLLDRLMRPKS